MTYVHGYDPREAQRLADQAGTLAELLHDDTAYPAGSRVLEPGCGVGAQTVELAARSPGARITAVELAADSVAEARRRTAGHMNVEVVQGDLHDLPFAAGAFDHVFVCFVLEHLRDPGAALRTLARHLRPGGTLTVIEGDHGSARLHPESPEADAAIACQTELQRRAGGDPTVGRRLYPLLAAAGYADVRVTPRTVYVDASRPALADAVIRRTFTAMIAGTREAAIAAGLTTPERFDAGIRGLERTTEPDGVFTYTFFKAVGVLPAH